MGKLIDYIMTGSWKDMQEISLMKKIGKKLDSMSNADIDEEIKKLEKLKKK
jgi:hypothetical protein